MAGSAFSKSIIFLIVSASIIGTISGQRTTTKDPIGLEPLPDAATGGKYGNPGALIRLFPKALDTIYVDSLANISESIKSIVISEMAVRVTGGTLTVKSARITEAKIANYERQLLAPNKIQSRLTGGRIVSIGEWQFKPIKGDQQVSTGVFRATVVNGEMNTTNQLSRSWDGRPVVETTQCKADLRPFNVELQGMDDDATVIVEQCKETLCKRIRNYLEEAVCNTAKRYIQETFKQKLATFPTQVNLGNDTDNRFVLRYDLLNGEPKINDQEQGVRAAMKGEVVNRGTGSNPFYANDLKLLDDRLKALSFSLSDYAFNTLFYQAHNQRFRFSAIDLLSESNPLVKDFLRMDCTGPVNTRRYKSPWGMRQQGQLCLGSIFQNSTVGKFPPGALGDLVFSSIQRPVQVIVRESPQKSCFHIASACVDAYGPVGADGKREFLGRGHIVNYRGAFTPKLNETKSSTCYYCVTGSVDNITNLQLTPCPPPVQTRQAQALNEQQLADLSKLSAPILTETFNAFMNRYAQFPVPFVMSYACVSPEFRWTDRTMQVDCDVRVSANLLIPIFPIHPIHHWHALGRR